MKKLLLLLVILFGFATLVQAVPPTVDFNFTPTTPGINQTIIFDPGIVSAIPLKNVRWQFASDGNVNYFATDSNTIIDKNFNINLNGWTTQFGSWSIVDAQLESASADSTLSFPISYNGQTTVNFFVDANLTVVGNGQASFNEPSATIAVPTNYNIGYTNAEQIEFRYGTTNLLTLGTIPHGTRWDANAVRQSDGNWSLYLNGVYKGSIVNTTSDMNGSFATLTYGDAGAGVMRVGRVALVVGSAINGDLNQTHSFTTSGGKSVCLTGGNTDGNTTLCKTVTVGNTFNFGVYDENLLTPIVGASVVIDSNTYTTDSSGQAFVNVADISFPTTATVSFTNYDSRGFYYLDANGMMQDRNVLLRYAPTTQNIDFQFFQPNKTTLLSNRVIAVSKNNKIAGRVLTDDAGKAILNLAPQESTYRFYIYPVGTDKNLSTIDFNYGTISITVNRPKNEATNVDINSPEGFNLNVGGLGKQDFNTNVFPSTNIVIIGNTIDAYLLSIRDVNSLLQQYFARSYILNDYGSVSQKTIQPYLIDIDDGTLTNVRVIDIPSNLTIPDIRFTLSSGINNSIVVVEDTITDATGTGQVVLLSQKLYQFQITDMPQQNIYFSGNIQAVSDKISFYINYTNTDTNFTPKQISYSISPLTDTLSGTTARIDFNVSADFNYTGVLVQTLDNNHVRNSILSTSNPFNSGFNVTLGDFNSQNVILRITVIGEDNNTVLTKNYFITSTGNGGVMNLVGLGNNFGPGNMLFVAILLVIGLVAIMGQGVLGNNDAQVFVGAIAFGIIAFLFFRENFLFIVGGLFAGGIAWMWTRVNR